jgi:hypothetical protein
MGDAEGQLLVKSHQLWGCRESIPSGGHSRTLRLQKGKKIHTIEHNPAREEKVKYRPPETELHRAVLWGPRM